MDVYGPKFGGKWWQIWQHLGPDFSQLHFGSETVGKNYIFEQKKRNRYRQNPSWTKNSPYRFLDMYNIYIYTYSTCIILCYFVSLWNEYIPLAWFATTMPLRINIDVRTPSLEPNPNPLRPLFIRKSSIFIGKTAENPLSITEKMPIFWFFSTPLSAQKKHGDRLQVTKTQFWQLSTRLTAACSLAGKIPC